jgi:DNA repair protein RadC
MSFPEPASCVSSLSRILSRCSCASALSFSCVKRFRLVQDRCDFDLSMMVSRSSDAYEFLRLLLEREANWFQEHLCVLFISRSNAVVGYSFVSSGGLTGTIADCRIMLAMAILSGCVLLVLSHNHPSGNLRPSRAAEELTRCIGEAAKYHDITILDHIILTEDGYYSFADEGIL